MNNSERTFRILANIGLHQSLDVVADPAAVLAVSRCVGASAVDSGLLIGDSKAMGSWKTTCGIGIPEPLGFHHDDEKFHRLSPATGNRRCIRLEARGKEVFACTFSWSASMV